MLVLVLTACHSAPAQMSLELRAGQQTYTVGQTIPLTWRLYNHTQDTWIVLSHYATPGENQYDQVQLRIDGPTGKRTLYLSGERAASNLVACRLLPGRFLENSFDMARWAKALSYTLQPGAYSIVANYQADPGIIKKWAGRGAIPICGGGEAQQPTSSEKIWSDALVSPPLSIAIR